MVQTYAPTPAQELLMDNQTQNLDLHDTISMNTVGQIDDASVNVFEDILTNTIGGIDNITSQLKVPTRADGTIGVLDLLSLEDKVKHYSVLVTTLTSVIKVINGFVKEMTHVQ